MKTINEKLKEFDEWADKNTAGFEMRGNGEDSDEYNVGWKDLAFYDDLVEEIKKLLED